MTVPAMDHESPVASVPGSTSNRADDGAQPGWPSYLLLGVVFGIVLTKSEAISWFRIQEMFRFDSFHMYGIMFAAVVVAGLSVFAINRFNITTLRGDAIHIPPKTFGRTGSRYWIGGTFFGFGWALLGACPGPMFALIGGGFTVIVVALVSAVLGTWCYGLLRSHLPHG